MLVDRRYELKFVVSPAQKERFLGSVRHALKPDPHGTDAAYRVTSQYYDSPKLSCYWEKVDGVALRKKIRLRFYGDVDPEVGFGSRAAFLEIKHRLNECISKERVALRPESAVAILEDSSRLLHLDELLTEEERRHRQTIALIELTAGHLALVATDVITYRREAWMGTFDSRLRLTFDHFVHALAPDRYLDLDRESGVPLIPTGHAVMEVKFNRRIPRWIRDTIMAQGLAVQRFSKYANGIEALGRLPGRQRLALIRGPTSDFS